MRLAADANVLLAAVLGGRAKLVFLSGKVDEVLTTEHTFGEVEQYISILARKRRLPHDLLLLTLAAMPLTIVAPPEYSASISEARRRIAHRDPDDVDILALALRLQIPLWSNDKDFTGTGIDWMTTEGLMKKLGLI